MDFLSFDAFFFDFDGLLVDTEPLHYLAYQELLKRRSLQLPWDFTTYCHYAHQKTEVFANAIFTLFPALKQEEPNWMILREEKQAIYQKLLVTQTVPLMKGAGHLLTWLDKHKKSMYVVTNATKIQVEAIRKLQPILNIIPSWITREDYTHPKPFPDSYLRAFELHGNAKAKCIGFEDSVKGIQALKATCITPVLVLPSTYPIPDATTLNQITLLHSLEEVYHRI